MAPVLVTSVSSTASSAPESRIAHTASLTSCRPMPRLRMLPETASIAM
jgi:hypothetical protein